MEQQTILLVDDDPDTLTIYSAVLEHHGYRVLQASSGVAGLDLARRHRPDLILMDLNMPSVDGLIAAEILKGDPWTARIPIVAFTIYDQARVREQIFDGFLTKPCSWSRVLEEIERLLGPSTPDPFSPLSSVVR